MRNNGPRGALRAKAPELERLLDEIRSTDATPDRVDVIAAIRELQSVNFFPDRPPVLPQLADITFDSPSSLADRIQQYIGDEPMRRRIAAEQCAYIESRFSYTAGMRRVVEWIQRTLMSEATNLGMAA